MFQFVQKSVYYKQREDVIGLWSPVIGYHFKYIKEESLCSVSHYLEIFIVVMEPLMSCLC